MTFGGWLTDHCCASCGSANPGQCVLSACTENGGRDDDCCGFSDVVGCDDGYSLTFVDVKRDKFYQDCNDGSRKIGNTCCISNAMTMSCEAKAYEGIDCDETKTLGWDAVATETGYGYCGFKFTETEVCTFRSIGRFPTGCQCRNNSNEH